MRLIYQNSNLLYFLWYMIIFATSQWYMYMYAVMSKPTFIKIIVELRGPWRDAKRSPISIPYIGNKRNPWVDFLMVIMASGIATTTMTESRNMTAILQITGSKRVMQPWFTVYFFGIGHPCYDQLTPVKTRYLLTSITRPYRGLELTAYRGQVFFWSWPLTRCWFFDWIAGSCLVNLLKTGQDCSEAGWCPPRIKR